MSEITTATEDDLPALVELLAVLFAQEHEFAPNAQAQSKGLAAIIGNPEVGSIIVLRDGDNILGMVILLYTVSTALGARVALLEDMVIAPAARGSGMGSRLLSSALEHARAAGCKRVTLLTDDDNQEAQRLYRKHGFRRSSMVPMRLALT